MNTVAITTYLAKVFGPTLARILLATLLKGHIDFSAIGIETGDLAGNLADGLDIGGLVDKITAHDEEAHRKAVRNANYLFDKIGDEAAERLVEVFQREGDALPEVEWQLTVDAAKDTLNRHGLAMLIGENLSAPDFRRTLRTTPPSPEFTLETEGQAVLYRRLLDTSAQVVFAIADNVPHFTRDATAKLLQNEAVLLKDMTAVLDNQAVILQETYGQQRDEDSREFASAYRTLIGNVLNNLLLFGVDHFDGTRQPLSVAYVRLRVEIGVAAQERGGFDEMKHGGMLREWRSLPVEEALSRGKRLLIVSDAGSGKTTLLKWIAVQAAGQGFEGPLDTWAGHMPFFVRLRDYATKESELPTFDNLAFSLREIQRSFEDTPEQWTQGYLHSGQALILVDGLDEVSSATRLAALEWLERLMAVYPDVITVVSSRPSGLQDQSLVQGLNRLGFEQMRLLKMDDEQVQAFIRQWHEAMAHDYCRYPEKLQLPDKEQALQNSIERRDDLKKLAQSPILCAMLCALNLFELETLPHDRIRLYNRCIDILLRRDINRNVDQSEYTAQLRPDTARQRLAEIAYWMMENNPALIGREDAEVILAKDGLDGPAVLRFLADRSVIFQTQAVDEYAFIHRTFAEYLAGQEIVRDNRVNAVVRTHATNSEWHETIRLLAGPASIHARNQAILLNALFALSEVDDEHRYALHLLAWNFWDLLDTRTVEAKTAMLKHLDSLTLYGDASGLNLGGTQVSDVSVLASLSNLQHLSLWNTQVNDLSVLAGLTNLQQLDLSNTQVQDISALASLMNLQRLNLSSTQVSSLSALADLSKLKQLDLVGLTVNDISAMVKLTNLQRLNLQATEVSDISILANLIDLQHLDIMSTQVNDVSALSKLTGLQQLNVWNTQISDISALASLSNLQELYLCSVPVSDVSGLAVLSNLQVIISTEQLPALTGIEQVSGLGIIPFSMNRLEILPFSMSDISTLAGLSNLQWLNLSNTQVSDVSTLASLSILQQLFLSYTQVSDVSALTGLTNLQQLYLMNTQVNDVSALKGLTNLQQLRLTDTQVSDVSALAGLTNLEELDLSSTQVSDVSALAGLTRLQQLYLSSTQVSDVSALAGLTNLEELTLSSTQVSDVSALASLSNLKVLRLTGSRVRNVSALRKALPDLVIWA
ncbi:MAG: leucine-rich repeat domain-containing protein [Chloroflexota bacterium]